MNATVSSGPSLRQSSPDPVRPEGDHFQGLRPIARSALQHFFLKMKTFQRQYPEAMLALVLMDHYLRHRAQNADVRSPTPVIPPPCT